MLEIAIILVQTFVRTIHARLRRSLSFPYQSLANHVTAWPVRGSTLHHASIEPLAIVLLVLHIDPLTTRLTPPKHMHDVIVIY